MSKRPVRSHTISKSCKIQPNTQVTLERVIGFTLNSNCAVAFSDKTGLIAHAAGCVTVLHSFENERQQFIQSQSRKAITAVDFSSDGKYLATGESGHQPMVRLWNVSDHCQLAEFGGHHFRVAAVRFSPNDQYLVSVGSQEDHTLYVWDRHSGQRVASAKVTSRIYGVAFSPTGQFFVTVGVRYVRFWYLENKRNKIRETLPLHGRNAILGDMFNSVFTDVCCVNSSSSLSSSSPPLSSSCTLSSSNPGSTQIHSAKLKSSTGSEGKDREDVTNNNSGKVASASSSSSPGIASTTTTTSTTLTLVVNTAGRLIQFNGQRDLDKWVDLKTSRANCISTSGSWVTVGCTTGVCLLFEAESLQFIAKLPLPHTLGSSLHLFPDVISSGLNVNESIYPDIIAIKLDCIRNRIICFYNDHSIHVWDIHDLTTINKCRSHYYHSRGIWSVDCLPEQWRQNNDNNDINNINNTIPLNHLPSWWSNDMFVTCSDDGTIRFWNLLANCQSTTNSLTDNGIRLSTSVPANSEFIGSTTFECTEQLAGIIYTDPSLKYLCTSDRSSIEITLSKLEGGIGLLGGPGFVPGTNDLGQIDSALQSPASPSRPSISEHFQLISSLTSSSNTVGSCNTTTTNSSSSTTATTTIGSTGVRTICISPDGRHLAAGDRDGSLRVYSLETLKLCYQIPAHDNEILSLNFFQSYSVPQLLLLCSASRDRMIHIFDPNKEYSRVQTISDHSGAIFSAKIIETDDGEIRLISCGMDKSLLFRILEPDESGQTAHFALEHHLVGRHSQLDAAITPMLPSSIENRINSTNRKRYLAVACQDRRLRIYNVITARPIRCYRGSYTEDGFLVRCSIDPTGSLIATSGSDKQLNIFHLLTGESIATLYGHSEMCLGLKFLPNLRYLISVSADSCIFVWRLSTNLAQYLHERITTSCMLKNILGNSISYPQLDGIPLEMTNTRLKSGREDSHGLLNINCSDYSHILNDDNVDVDTKRNMTSRKYTSKHNNSNNNDDGVLNDCNSMLYNSEMNEYENDVDDDNDLDNYGDDDDDEVTSFSQTMPPSEWNESLAEYDKIENLDDDDDDENADDDNHGEDNEFDAFPLDDVLSVNVTNPVTFQMNHLMNKRIVMKHKSVVDNNNKNILSANHLIKSQVSSSTTTTNCSVGSSAATNSVNQNSNDNDINGSSSNRNAGKKPEFYFSVSALPAWARRKLSRRESVTITPTSLTQVLNSEFDVNGSDSASQTSVGSGPILPVSTRCSGSHETIPNYVYPLSSSVTAANRKSKFTRVRGKTSTDDISKRDILTPVFCATTTTVVSSSVSQSTISTNNHNHTLHSQMSRSEYNTREYFHFHPNDEINSNEQITHERKNNWFTRAVSAPDTPRSWKKDAYSVDNKRNIVTTGLTTTPVTSATTTTTIRTRKIIDSSAKKLYPTQRTVEASSINRVSTQNRPKDLALEQFTPPTHTYEVCANRLLINESIAGGDCPNALPLFNRPKNKSSQQRSYSATQLIPSSSPTQHNPPPSKIVDDSVSLYSTNSLHHFLDDTNANCALNYNYGDRCQQRNQSKDLRASVDITSKALLMSSKSSSSYHDSKNRLLAVKKYSSQYLTNVQETNSRMNSESVPRSSTHNLNSTLSQFQSEELDSSRSAVESLHALRVALDLAISRLAKLSCYNHKSEEHTNLCQIVTEQLEWRFSRLRAMLGLSPVCVEAPVARVLIADIVERLIPELKSASSMLDSADALNNSTNIDNVDIDNPDNQVNIENKSQFQKAMNLSDTSGYKMAEMNDNSTITNHKTVNIINRDGYIDNNNNKARDGKMKNVTHYKEHDDDNADGDDNDDIHETFIQENKTLETI
uniref:Putative wd40 protein n=1 Tax=Schistosoma mansoni TaxID=6183 RepID=A0A3Q0KPB6_SCHMA